MPSLRRNIKREFDQRTSLKSEGRKGRRQLRFCDIGTAMRCMIFEPVPVLPHDRQQACHDGDHRHHLRPHTLDRTFHDGVVRSPRVSARPSMSRRNLISASAWFR
jgi:hypothetical protein